MTARSPKVVGSVAMRRSMARSPTCTVARPSCGSRFSAMFMCPITLTRLTTSSCSALGTSKESYSTPSIRSRTTSDCSYGCTWTSEARACTASNSTRLTSLMTGARLATSSKIFAAL